MKLSLNSVPASMLTSVGDERDKLVALGRVLMMEANGKTFNKVRKGDFSGIAIDYSVTVAALASHRTIEGENVSLEQLAKQFNLGLKR